MIWYGSTLISLSSPLPPYPSQLMYRYPHLACEVLTCGVMSIVEQLVTTPSLLDMLWAFLDTTEPLNPLLASFISKVLGMLLEKQQSVVSKLLLEAWNEKEQGGYRVCYKTSI